MIVIFEWLVVLAESIILTVMSFFAILLLLWTATMADILADENGQLIYCETPKTGVENKILLAGLNDFFA